MYLVVICLINYHSSCNLIKEYKHTHIKTKTKHVCFVFKFPLLTFYPAVLSPSSSHQTIRASQMPLCLRLDVITPLGTAGQKYKKNKKTKQNLARKQLLCCSLCCGIFINRPFGISGHSSNSLKRISLQWALTTLHLCDEVFLRV